MYKERDESSSSGLKNQDTKLSVKIVFLMLSRRNHLMHRSDEDPIPVPREGIAAHAYANYDGGERGRYGG